MKRQRIAPDMESIPEVFRPLLQNSTVWDSSCSPEARVYYIDRQDGFFLKSAARGSLRREAEMAKLFAQMGLGANVLAYESLEQDWLLTAKLPGEDCLQKACFADPLRLSEKMGQILRQLHSIKPPSGPLPNRTEEYLRRAKENYLAGKYDKNLFPDNWGYTTAGEAWQIIEKLGGRLSCDTLIHGDYCLPNILLDNWRFSGLIDLGGAGLGDRHMDLFWGIWTLQFNLKTDRFRDRFLDAYGRQDVHGELLRVVAALEVFQ